MEPESAQHQVTVVLVQSDRKQFAGALERLLAVLGALQNISFRVLVMDNADPGGWSHALTDRITHVGGDNSSQEFSAFDKGLAFAREQGFEQDLFLLVTDTYAAYGSEFLDLIREDVFEAAISWNACVGWIDAAPSEMELYGSLYQEWLRTSFVIAPGGVILEVGSLVHNIDEKAVFGGDSRSVFLEDSPVGSELQNFIRELLLEQPGAATSLTEQWHSKIELTDENYPLFQAKSSAIIREHMLSVRLEEAGIPVFDFRLFGHLRENSSEAKFWLSDPSEDWQWLDGARSDLFPSSTLFNEEVKYHIDSLDMPPCITVGDDESLLVVGWARGSKGIQRIESVTLSFSEGGSAEAFCDLERHDLRTMFSDGRDVRCGFSLEASLKHLAPGRHDVTLQVADSGLVVPLGSVRVLQRLQFKPSRVFVPEWRTADIPTPVALEGEMLCSRELIGVRLSLDGVELPMSVEWDLMGRREPGLIRYWLKGHGEQLLTAAGPSHALRLDFVFEGGVESSWTHVFSMRLGGKRGYAIHRWTLGSWRQDRGSVGVEIEGMLATADSGDHLVLLNRGREILRECPVPELDTTGNPVPFHIEREVVGLHPGKVELTLALATAGGLEVLEERTCVVAFETPEIYVDTLETELAVTYPEVVHRVRCVGWVRNHFLVDGLSLHLDGRLVSGFGIDQLRPDVSQIDGHSLVHHQGFDFAVDITGIAAGTHEIELYASQSDGDDGSFRRLVEFNDVPSATFRVVSMDLERLMGIDNTAHLGGLCFKGHLTSESIGVIAQLSVDDVIVDEIIFQESGETDFALRHQPEEAGVYTVRVRFLLSGRLCWDSGDVDLEFRPISLPTAATTTWNRFVDHFELRQHVMEDLSPDDMLMRLMAARSTPSRHWVDILEKLWPALYNPLPGATDLISTAEALSDRPLNVLFCSWETPHSGHGGGVHLVNLLRGLGERHEITLVHTYGDDLEYVDEVRPFVKRVLSVPRSRAPVGYCADGLLPARFYEQFNPELDRVIDRELSSGDYDLVNFEFSMMRLVPTRGVPSVMSIHELDYTSMLNTLSERAKSKGLEVDELGELLRMFYFNVVDLPSAFDALVTITREDAGAILRHNAKAKVFVNEAGAVLPSSAPYKSRLPELSDTSVGTGADGGLERRASPDFLFVANYRHPPNVLAAIFLAKKVMPLIRARIPGATLSLVGPHAPAEVAELAGNGVRLLGFVDDLTEIYEVATAVMVPIFTGTGMRIKSVEALSHGRPVIGTSLAMRGFESATREAFVVAETPEEFSEAACRIAGGGDFAAKLGEAGRAYVTENLSVSRLVEGREKVWASVVEQARSRHNER